MRGIHHRRVQPALAICFSPPPFLPTMTAMTIKVQCNKPSKRIKRRNIHFCLLLYEMNIYTNRHGYWAFLQSIVSFIQPWFKEIVWDWLHHEVTISQQTPRIEPTANFLQVINLKHYYFKMSKMSHKDLFLEMKRHPPPSHHKNENKRRTPPPTWSGALDSCPGEGATVTSRLHGTIAAVVKLS